VTEPLLEALSRAAAALEEGDPEAAATALDRAAARAQELERSGARLPPGDLERAVALHAACAAAADRAGARLLGAIGTAGRTARALDAYRR